MQENTGEIILVEDNPAELEMTLAALKERNLANKVQVLRDGAEALTYIMNNVDCRPGMQQHHPKVILLDLKLPKVDGLEVLRRIRADERTETVAGVILTSPNEERVRIEGYKLGAN